MHLSIHVYTCTYVYVADLVLQLQTKIMRFLHGHVPGEHYLQFHIETSLHCKLPQHVHLKSALTTCKIVRKGDSFPLLSRLDILDL